MKNGMSVDGLLKKLKDENIQTWFDLGLFIDRFKEESPVPSFVFSGRYDDFKKTIKTGGVAFITYHYMVDGVTVEVEKYAELFRRNIPGVPIHYIAGSFKSKSETLIHKSYSTCEIPILKGFDDWALYNDFFNTDLERG